MNTAHLAASGKHAIGTLTLMNPWLDYAEPGQLGCFVDEGTVHKLERRMAVSRTAGVHARFAAAGRSGRRIAHLFTEGDLVGELDALAVATREPADALRTDS